MSSDRWTRRQFLTRGVGAGGGLALLAASGYTGYRWPGRDSTEVSKASSPTTSTTTAPAATDTEDVNHFVSRPDLRPPRVTMTRRPGSFAPSPSAPRCFFVTPKGYETTGPGEAGLMIVDSRGGLVWFLPKTATSVAPFDLQVQTYRGKPVLTWWEGTVISGYGRGTCTIADSSYRPIATVRAGNGLDADLHEFNLTPQGTALITAYRTATTDLSALGGPTAGKVLACQAQEIDIATGKVLFSWDSLDHVAVTETYQDLPGGKQEAPFDYFHINSVSLAADGDLLISSRNTWTVYKVDRSSGKIVWRLNGKKSDFTMGKGTKFYWQHHVRAHSADELSLFDDGSSPPEESESRGLVLHVDTGTMRAELVRRYVHPSRLLAANQGSVQLLDDGHVLVGWGDQPYFSEFERDGTLVADGRFPTDDQSYRAFTYGWTGQPTDEPAIAVQSDTTGGATVYASWNGSTEVHTWQILSGPSASALSSTATARRADFETVISVDRATGYFAVEALDRHGHKLGRSKAVHHA